MNFCPSDDARSTRYVLMNRTESLSHCCQPSLDTSARMRCPSSPLKGARSRPGKSFFSNRQWTIRSGTSALLAGRPRERQTASAPIDRPLGRPSCEPESELSAARAPTQPVILEATRVTLRQNLWHEPPRSRRDDVARALG